MQESLGEGVSVFLSDVESDPWSEEELTAIVSSCDRLLITKGDKGAEELIGVQFRRDVEAAKVENVIDTNGAGDTFATAYMLGLAANVEDPAWVASQAAARIVTKPQVRSISLLTVDFNRCHCCSRAVNHGALQQMPFFPI